jgi:hypothetical protein
MKVAFTCAEDNTITIFDIVEICFCPDNDEEKCDHNTMGEMCLLRDGYERFCKMDYGTYSHAIQNWRHDGIDLTDYAFTYRDEDTDDCDDASHDNF